jgi:hypothetical protein
VKYKYTYKEFWILTNKFIKLKRRDKDNIDNGVLDNFYNLVWNVISWGRDDELLLAERDTDFINIFPIYAQIDSGAWIDANSFTADKSKNHILNKKEHYEIVERLKKYNQKEITIELLKCENIKDIVFRMLSDYYEIELNNIIKEFELYLKGIEVMKIINKQEKIKTRYHFNIKNHHKTPYVEINKILGCVDKKTKVRLFGNNKVSYVLANIISKYHYEIKLHSGNIILIDMLKKNHNCFLFTDITSYDEYIQLLSETY